MFDTPESLATFADTLVIDVLDAMGLDRPSGSHVVRRLRILARGCGIPEPIDRIVEFGWTVGAPLARLPALMRLATVPWVGRLMTAIAVSERAVRASFARSASARLSTRRIP